MKAKSLRNTATCQKLWGGVVADPGEGPGPLISGSGCVFTSMIAFSHFSLNVVHWYPTGS